MFKIDPILGQILVAAGLDAGVMFVDMEEGEYRQIQDMPEIELLGRIEHLAISRKGDTLHLDTFNYYDNISCIEITEIEIADAFYDASSSEPHCGGTKFKHSIVLGSSINRGLSLDPKVEAAVLMNGATIQAQYGGKMISDLRQLPAFLPDACITRIHTCGFVDITSDFVHIEPNQQQALKAA